MTKQRRKLAPAPGGLRATTTIQKLGGPQAVADLLGITAKAVYAWDTYVPRKHQAALNAALG